MEKKYSKEVALDFCKALEKSKVIIKNAHKNERVIDTLYEVINCTEKSIKKESATAQMFFHEFTDWIETYVA